MKGGFIAIQENGGRDERNAEDEKSLVNKGSREDGFLKYGSIWKPRMKRFRFRQAWIKRLCQGSGVTNI